MPNTAPKIHVLEPEKYELFRAEMKAKYEKTKQIFRATTVRDGNREIIGFDFPCEDGSVIRVGPTFYPWVAHERNTWPHRYMTTKVPVVLKKWNQKHPVDENTTEETLPVGSRVKIVMASRFGDVGITDDLTAEHGYHARVSLEELDKQFEQFSNEP